MLFSVKTFGGMLPRIGPRLLQDANAQTAIGTKLRSGVAEPFNAPAIVKTVAEPTTDYKSLYLYEHGDEDVFMFFEDDVDIVKGPVANDANNRTYITGLDVPRVFDTTLVATDDAVIDSTNSYKLAIQQPSTVGTLTKAGTGSGDPTSRSYVYTYMREWSDGKLDEGQTKGPALDGSNDYIDVLDGEVVTLSDITPDADATNTGVDRIAIYRVATGTSDAQFQLVTDFDVEAAKLGSVADVTWNGSTFSFEDNVAEADLGELFKATTWAAPQDDLKGLISLRNGSLAGFVDNIVYISEAYQLNAWPYAYTVTVDQDIVGLGAFGNTLVVLTNEFPIMIDAQDPSMLIPVPVQSTAPCVSKRGIVNYENAVFFPTTDGVMQISGSGITNITQTIIHKEAWQEYNPSSFEAAVQNGRYFAFYEKEDTETGFFIIDLEEQLAAMSTEVFNSAAFFVDSREDTLYFVHKDTTAGWLLSRWEGLSASNRTLTWKSKQFVSGTGRTNLAAARVRAQFLSAAELAELNATLADLANDLGDLDGAVNEVPFNTLCWNGDIYEAFRSESSMTPFVQAKFYVDGELKFTKAVTSSAPFRLPAGFVGDMFEVEVSSNMNIYQIDMATSMKELK